MRRLAFIVPIISCASLLSAQTDPRPTLKERPKAVSQQSEGSAIDDAPLPGSTITLPTGTKVLLILKNSISTRNARPGDGVYLESTFPVMAQGKVVIPAGTFVQGVVSSAKRSGRVKGRAEILVHFNTLIYPNGYTVSLPGALESADSSDAQRVKDKEGTVQADGNKGKDAATIATAAGTGGLIGGLSRGSMKGAGIGGGIGAAVGAATVLFTRGDEVKLDAGTSVEMVLERPLDLDLTRIDPNARNASPTPQRPRKLDPASKPTLTPLPGIGGVR
jgi:hypothetical protein